MATNEKYTDIRLFWAELNEYLAANGQTDANLGDAG
jgi:hypothetical protein